MPWAPSLGLELAFRIDGLSLLFLCSSQESAR
jgi:NADH:ubiquinone oxidoreductase subunit 5 (subunit L)/multisubunit Na+/H+ antiporter MnhA subunit